MNVYPETPLGYYRLHVGWKFKRTDLEPQFNKQKHSESTADDSFSPQWSSFEWKPLDRDSGVDDYRVEKGEFIIRKKKHGKQPIIFGP